MKLHRTPEGWIGNPQKPDYIEAGDSLAWNGWWLFLNEGKDPKTGLTIGDYLAFFNVGFGAYVRYPISEQTNKGFGAHYKHPWNGCVSRDQQTGLIAAIVKGDYKLEMLKLMIHHAAWLFLFSYNTIKNGKNPETAKWKWPDFTGPDIWASELRGFGWISWLFWPILVLFDIQTLFNAMLHNKKNGEEVNNFVFKLMIAYEYVPTPTACLAKKITNWDEIYREIDKYWCGGRDNCRFAQVFKKTLRTKGYQN